MLKKAYILIVFVFFCCKTEKPIKNNLDFTINISLSNTKENTKLLLKKQEGYLTINLDSTTIRNKKATFKGTINSPAVYGIFIENYKQGIFPIIEKGTIFIKADLNDFTNAQISGTSLNDQLADYKRNSKEISSKMNGLFHQFQKARAENNSEKLAEINLQMKTINNEKNKFSLHFIRNNPNSFVASMVLHSLLKSQDLHKDSIAKYYKLLSNEVKKSEFSKDILLELEMKTLAKDSLN